MATIEPLEVIQWNEKHLSAAKHDLLSSAASNISLSELLDISEDRKQSEKALSLSELKLKENDSGLGNVELRNNLAALYSARSGGVTENDIIITNGSAAADYTVFSALLGPGDHVICQHPVDELLYKIPASLRANVTWWNADPVKKWELDIEELKTLIRDETKLIAIQNPCDPTGAIVSRPILEALVEVAEEKGITILADETYRPLFHSILPSDDDFPPSTINLGYKKVVVTGAVSKAYGLAGTRTGWIATKDRTILDTCRKFRRLQSTIASTLDEVVAAEAVSDRCIHALLARNIKLCQTNLNLLQGFVEEHSWSCSWVKPRAGTTAMLKFHKMGKPIDGISSSKTASTAWEKLRQTDISSLSTAPDDGQSRVELYGYITSHRPGRGFDFIQLVDPRLELAVQVIFPHSVSAAKVAASPPLRDETDAEEPGAKRKSSDKDSSEEQPSIFRAARPHTPIRISGTIVRRLTPPKKDQQQAASEKYDTTQRGKPTNTIRTLDPYVGDIDLISHVEIRADSYKFLNGVPSDLTAKCDTVFPPESRHLQFRTDSDLRRRIRLRSRLAGKIREHMLRNDFDEIETPLLFKSTPEGAREFIVPTRKRGLAYALPQSPQQYKQVLMASGIWRYFQFAKCFRDEDLRADRQPEFTQLDLEMAFASSADVMAAVEDLLIHAVWPNVPDIAPLQTSSLTTSFEAKSADPEYQNLAFPQMTYDTAMTRFGSDKPDTRLESAIRRVDQWLPSNMKGMVTSLDDPIMEMVKINMQGCGPADSQKFVTAFLEASPTARYTNDSARIPGVAVFDPLKPLHGLASFGHEGAAKVEEEFEPEPGDILILYSRDDKPFTGGSTVLGDLRRDIYQYAISEGLIPAPSGFCALWITDFPLFSPTEESEPGQGGSAGICSTHHPFTAPKQGQDLSVSMFKKNPLSIIGDHYDLVINGVEVGGGSCRIHREFMQEFIFREVLKMDPERVKHFGHLLRALRSGCPPHAGFALGFDRLMVILTNSASVRDVIAFPKYADGEDKFAGAPSPITRDQLATYHLVAADDRVPASGSSAKVSRKA
ncbi:aspartate-tRNA ligase [Fonsecaea erecta]|uniref:Aspartate-tRNA ligase n=1 Tax=Fonsecaea erecta TaxID=1367422 RepID=A0A178ZR53_9EURO|nr:aspartate-tRNA ligase [Fonsecaea erecta]OAP62290.1 aspartate-tRNA ligase [Fonsecaea erecta]